MSEMRAEFFLSDLGWHGMMKFEGRLCRLSGLWEDEQ
jgi:hypothetical protein